MFKIGLLLSELCFFRRPSSKTRRKPIHGGSVADVLSTTVLEEGPLRNALTAEVLACTFSQPCLSITSHYFVDNLSFEAQHSDLASAQKVLHPKHTS